MIDLLLQMSKLVEHMRDLLPDRKKKNLELRRFDKQ